jgi:hypothetical protein
VYDPAKLGSTNGIRAKGGVAKCEIDKGEIEKWVGEARSPSMLVRIGGWNKSTIKPGDVITASGHRAKNGSNVLRLQKIVLPDGREMADL